MKAGQPESYGGGFAVTVLFRVFALLCLGAALAGCYPTSENPIGVATAAPDSRLLGAWKGQIGTDKDASASLYVFPREGGRFEAMLIHAASKDDKGGWTTASLVPGKIGSTTVLNAKLILDDGAPAKEGTADYTPVMYRFDAGGVLRLFMLDDKALETAIRAGRIAGTIKENSFGDDVRLTADAKSLDAFFAANAATLFTQAYGIFRRVN
jgi:hypothetical protein